MFSSMKNFLNRHRRKFLIGGVVVAGGMLTLRYAQRKLIEYQEAKAREFIERTRKTQHFESTERTCNQAIMGLAPNLIEQILKSLDADSIVAELRNDPSEKILLWNRLKVLAIARLCALVYACSMLTITLRVQFNILGGYLYKDAVSNEEKITAELQQSYVALIQHFLTDGVESLCSLIQKKVDQILNSYDLSRKLTLAETEQIFCTIQMAVNSDTNDPSSHLAYYVYPSDLPACTSNPLFEKMYNETIDMLESNDVSTLNANNVSRGFSIVMDNIADFYFKPVNGTIVTENGAKFNHIENKITEITDNDASTSQTLISEPLANINTTSIPIPKLIPGNFFHETFQTMNIFSVKHNSVQSIILFLFFFPFSDKWSRETAVQQYKPTAWTVHFVDDFVFDFRKSENSWRKHLRGILPINVVTLHKFAYLKYYVCQSFFQILNRDRQLTLHQCKHTFFKHLSHKIKQLYSFKNIILYLVFTFLFGTYRKSSISMIIGWCIYWMMVLSFIVIIIQ